MIRRLASVMRVCIAVACAALLLPRGNPASAQAVTQWSQFLGNSAHTSYSTDPAINASNAASFGVKWMANLYSPDLGSPVVAFNGTLGKTVVYVANQRADIFAIDAATGQQIWSQNLGLGDQINATPAVGPDGSVWVATNYKAKLYKLNGATGAILCSVPSPNGMPIQGSPMIPSVGASMYWIVNDSNTVSGPIVATNQSTCSTIFQFYGYRVKPSGGWTTPAYATTATGESIVINGTADPDSTVYAVDASTGALVWKYHTYNPSEYDVGDGATVSAPGTNGFADGVVYVNNKYGIEYALDLTTGALIWSYSAYPSGYSGYRNDISSAALDGNQIVFGYANGLVALNATSGAPLWSWPAPAEVASSPAIIGPPGSEVVAFADLTGAFRVSSLSTGTPLYKYQTGGYITSSVAEYNGVIYIASSDGFLYAFAPGGGNGAAPSDVVTSPSNNVTVPNPNGSLTISGTSSDGSSVSAVEVAVQASGSAGLWYNAAANSWGPSPVSNPADLSNAGSASTAWSFALPVATDGGSYKVFVNTINGAHITDRGSSVAFTVSPSSSSPTLSTSAFYVAPGQTFRATGGGFLGGEHVTFTLFGKTAGNATAEKSGALPSAKVTVPATAPFGPTTLTATGSTSLKTSTATVYVSNSWSQFGYSSLRQSAEPNDPVIATTIDVGQGTTLGKSWVYASGAPINTEPAVVNGYAYIGNDAGVLSAVNIQSGSPAWTYDVPSGASIRASPAVDPSGNVIFGATDGNLYVVSSTGSLVKSISLGGNLTPPAVNDGTIVVASDSGAVYSIADGTWTTNWSVNAGAAVHSPPSFDPQNALVIFGTSGGAVVAVNSDTGARVWTAATGGAITGAPAIFNGAVYVGSADAHVYAYNETTGTSQWTFTADAPIQGGVAVGVYRGQTTVEFGTNSGSLYQLSSTGAQQLHEAGTYGKSAVVGFAAAEDSSFGTLTNGTIGMVRLSGGRWSFRTGGSLTAPPAILNGPVYLGAGNGNLHAFSPNAATPMSVMQNGGAIVTVTSGWTCTTPQ